MLSGSVGQAWCCSCSNIVFIKVSPLASFAEVGFVCGNVKNGCSLELGQLSVESSGSRSSPPCKQQEIYRDFFSVELNRQNHVGPKTSLPGHWPPSARIEDRRHDSLLISPVKNKARRGNPHRVLKTHLKDALLCMSPVCLSSKISSVRA